MHIKLKRIAEGVIWEGEAVSLAEAVCKNRATLWGVDLRVANLRGATLWGATLRGANLFGANLFGANLSEANLRGANLLEANLRGANLLGADLRGANLLGADLRGATLWGVDLLGANLKRTHLGNPNRLLEASWGIVSDDLCRLLMAYDAANHPNGREAFTVWAKGGACPYINIKVSRAANFTEKRDLWDANAPVLSAYELMVRLIREKCADSDFHAKE